jgi:hypothetical protein
MIEGPSPAICFDGFERFDRSFPAEISKARLTLRLPKAAAPESSMTTLDAPQVLEHAGGSHTATPPEGWEMWLSAKNEAYL